MDAITIKLTGKQSEKIERICEITGLTRHAVARSLLSHGCDLDLTTEQIVERVGLTTVRHGVTP